MSARAREIVCVLRTSLAHVDEI